MAKFAFDKDEHEEAKAEGKVLVGFVVEARSRLPGLPFKGQQQDSLAVPAPLAAEFAKLAAEFFERVRGGPDKAA